MLHLIAAVALLQQEAPEEIYKRLEETLARAKSLKIKSRVDLEGGGQKGSITTTVLLKGKKFKIVTTGPNWQSWVVWDGVKVSCDPRQALAALGEWEPDETTKDKVVAWIVRWGCLDLASLPRRIRVYGTDARKQMIVSDLKYGDPDGDQKNLTFVLQQGKHKADIKLWYDPKSLAPRKRKVSLGEKGEMTETFEEFSVDGEIPDADFQPRDK